MRAVRGGRLPAFSLYAGNLWHLVASSKTIGAAVRAATGVFESRATTEPAASAEFLAMAAFRVVNTRSGALRCEERPNAVEIGKYVELCGRREATSEPVQYLVGSWDFHHVELTVRAPTLIPRPETEELVEHVLATMTTTTTTTTTVVTRRGTSEPDHDAVRVLDVGCGSGAILVALLHARPSWTGVGIDPCTHAVSLSVQNARRYAPVATRAAFHHCDVAAYLEQQQQRQQGQDGEELFDVLVSNPPYIPDGEIDMLQEEVVRHESRRALSGGSDGLTIIKQILEAAPKLVRKGGHVWMEVDTSHPNVLSEMPYPGLKFVDYHHDHFGNARFCHWIVDNSSGQDNVGRVRHQ